MLQRTVELRASAAQAVGTETGDAANDGAVQLNDSFEQMNVVLDVTDAATGSDDTLDVYIDTKIGGTWVNIGHFTQVLGDGGAKKFIMSFRANPIAASNSVAAGSDQSAGNALQIGFSNEIRYRATVVDPSGSDASFTYTVTAFFKKYA